MARVTARQAFTRARTKRLRTRAELNNTLNQQNQTYAERLSDLGIDIKEKMTKKRVTRSSANAEGAPKKITDYFASTNRLELKATPKRRMNSSSCIGSDGGRDNNHSRI